MVYKVPFLDGGGSRETEAQKDEETQWKRRPGDGFVDTRASETLRDESQGAGAGWEWGGG